MITIYLEKLKLLKSLKNRKRFFDAEVIFNTEVTILSEHDLSVENVYNFLKLLTILAFLNIYYNIVAKPYVNNSLIIIIIIIIGIIVIV